MTDHHIDDHDRGLDHDLPRLISRRRAVGLLLALPKAVCDEVYATSGYEQSGENLAQTSLEGDMVFGDGYRSQRATASGSASDAIALALNVGV